MSDAVHLPHPRLRFAGLQPLRHTLGICVFFKKKKKKAPFSDETSGDGNDHSDNLSEPGNTADTTDGTAHTEETDK